MKHSAGIIPFRVGADGRYQFFVGHPGGPFWKNKNYWSLLKGGVENGEDLRHAAVREFKEESGAELDYGEIFKHMSFVCTVKQRSGKMVTAYAIKMVGTDEETIMPSKCFSNIADGCDWPEIDEYRWVSDAEIIKCTNKTNVQFYTKIIEMDGNGDFGCGKYTNTK